MARPIIRASSGVAVLIALLLAASCKAEGQQKTPAEPAKPMNERETAAAWTALDKQDYKGAITHADKCIEEFRPSADRIQGKLKEQKANVPTGQVSEEEKKKVFANGLLNDVATCLFIKGRAAEQLGDKEKAKTAYEAAVRYTYARAWDEGGGFFWSPAEGASDRLNSLK